jgi:hypothetical protein
MSTEEALPEGLVGQASYSQRQYETFKLKKADDAFQFRPLPPMSPTLKKKRDVGLYWKTHFGYKGIDERGKERLRPFLCLEEKRDGRIVQDCPACTVRKSWEDKKLALIGRKKGIEEFAAKNKKSAAELRKAIQPVIDELKEANDWLFDHGCDGKFRLPCVNRQGKIGLFMMPFGALKKFRERCRELSQKLGIDPCGIKGVWFECTRTGMASRDSDDVQPVKIFDKEQQVERYEYHTLDNATLIAASEAIPDLGDLMEKGRYSYAQIAALMDCSGDPEEVDQILGIKKAAEPSGDDEGTVDESAVKPAPVDDDAFGPSDTKSEAAPPAKAKEPEPQPEPAKTAQELKSDPAPAEDDEEAAAERALAAARARKAAKAVAEAEAAQKAAAATTKAEEKPAAKSETKPASKPAAKSEAKPAVEASDESFEGLFNT